MALAVSLDILDLEAGRTQAPATRMEIGEQCHSCSKARHNYSHRRARGNSHRKAVAERAEPLTLGRLAHCGSSTNRWQGRPPGFCRWRCWEYSQSPGSD